MTSPTVEELLDILRRIEWACWAEHAECPACGAEPDCSYHKYGIKNGGHYSDCRLAKAIGATTFRTPPPPPPAWIKDGARVWYQSSPGPLHRYAGTVDGEPRVLGEHTWVVHLRDMDPKYRDGARSTVPAAACDALSPYDGEP